MLTSRQAAKRINRTADALCKAAQAGHIKAVKFGRVWMFEESEVERYAATPKPKGGRPRKGK